MIKKQLVLEAKISLGLTICYLVLWFVFGYGLSLEKGLFSLPLWFEFSCIYLPILFIIACILAVKMYFKNINLTDNF